MVKTIEASENIWLEKCNNLFFVSQKGIYKIWSNEIAATAACSPSTIVKGQTCLAEVQQGRMIDSDKNKLWLVFQVAIV